MIGASAGASRSAFSTSRSAPAAEAALASVSTVDVDQIAKATVYIKIMKKVIDNGSSYIADEMGRIQK